MIESPSLEAEKPVIEPLKAQIQHPTASVIEKPGVPSTSELNAIIQSAGAEKPASTAPIVPRSEVRTHLSTPMSSESPRVSMPTKSLENIGLGILAETRKQTLLMEHSMSAVSTPPSAIPTVAMPVMEMPAIEVFGEMGVIESQLGTALPTIETPLIKAETPIVQIAETPADRDARDDFRYAVDGD